MQSSYSGHKASRCRSWGWMVRVWLLEDCSFSCDHDDSLSVSGRKIGVHGSIDNEQVGSTVDLGVGVDDNTGFALGTHLGSTDVVATGLEVLDEVSAGDVGDTGGSNERKRGVPFSGHLDKTVHHDCRSLLVDVGSQVGVGDEVGGAIGSDAETTNRLGAVCDIDLHLDLVLCWTIAGSLEEDLLTLGSVDRSPPVEALTGLRKKTRTLREEVNRRLVGRCVCGLGFSAHGCGNVELDSEDWVVLDLLSNWKVNPVSLSWQFDTA
ncbi:hypothetical protein HBH48_101930 [Parastagonospora nodorum]|nr:hypothetical protein HBH48_101930 [Parastagonospora nodorum]